jgi:hypothetical protein
MTHETTVADQIVEVVSRSPGCLIEELVFACPGLDWNQVFLEVDRLSREGRVLLTTKGPGLYAVSLPRRESCVLKTNETRFGVQNT